MKNLSILFAAIVLLSVLFTSCSDEFDPGPDLQGHLVDEEGLSQPIRDLVPDSVLAEMEALGMVIHGGEHPPSIEGTYLATPFILSRSNRSADTPGMSFSDLEVTFYRQSNSTLTIQADYVNGTESGIGIGSYIVGEDCSFSVFLDLQISHTNGATASIVVVVSGTFEMDGIRNFQYANFMLDNHGNPTAVWINNNEGRVIFDSDGFSPRNGISSEWYTKLPPCPCTYEEVETKGVTKCPVGRWEACGPISPVVEAYHHGAKYEARWLPEGVDDPGQQCTYDSNKKLITSGIAAGTADQDSPDGCTGWDIGHIYDDVRQWDDIPCLTYLAEWPSNNELACTSNPVTPIHHMPKLCGELTCEELTLLIVSAEGGFGIHTDLQSYLLGDTTAGLTEPQLIQHLTDWRNAIPGPSDLSRVIDQAILNLEN